MIRRLFTRISKSLFLIFIIITGTTYAAEEKTDLIFKKESLVSQGEMVKVILVLLVMLILAFAVLWFLKKRLIQNGSITVKTGSQKKRIEIIEHKKISPKTMLTLVCVDGKDVLVATHKDDVELLGLAGLPVNNKFAQTDCEVNKPLDRKAEKAESEEVGSNENQ